MLFKTTLRLLEAFQTCPKCAKALYSDKLTVDKKSFSLGCDCGWALTGCELDVVSDFK